MDRAEDLTELAKFLVTRLERLSPDSGWARRVSGARGSILKLVERLEMEREQDSTAELRDQDLAHLRALVNWSFTLLEKAAREL